jgi:hypothetical protein
MSKREDIHVALLALLTAIGEPTGRNPEVPVDWDALGPSETKFLALLDGVQSKPTQENSAEFIRTLTAAIEGYVRADNSETIGTSLEVLRVQALEAVLADRTLGGLAWDVREGDLELIEINRENEPGPTGAFRQLIEVEYVTGAREF